MGGEPVTKRGGTLNCNTLFAFEVHAVHFGANVVLAADLVKLVRAANYRGPSGCLPHEWP